MIVHTFNPTNHDREEYVIFGTPEKTPYTFYNLPKSHLNVAHAKVSKQYTGNITLNPDTGEAFRLHDLIVKNVASGLAFYAQFNEEKVPFQASALHVNHSRVKIGQFIARSQYGVANLFVYVFHNQPTIRYEICMYAENLDIPVKRLKFSWGYDGGAQAIIRTYHASNENLFDGDIGDAQGRRWNGNIFFYDEEVLKDLEQPIVQTAFAQDFFPLYVLAPWDKWSVWGNPPPSFTLQEAKQKYFQISPYSRYINPLGHFGYIGNTYAGSTGTQGGFGTWQSIHTLGSNESGLLAFRDWQTQQEHCRPVNYFEADGKRVKSKDHPSWVTWSQVTHWHTGVSSDRLGRQHSGGSVGGWSGYDWQHQYTTCAHDIVVLLGSWAMKDWLKGKHEADLAGHTLPSTHPRWSTNKLNTGRSARSWFSVVNDYLATGDERVIRRLAKKIDEMGDQWAAANNPEWDVRPSKISGPDGRLFPNKSSVIVYEEFKFIKGLDSARIIMEDIGLTQQAAKIKDIIWSIGSSLIFHGFHPATKKIAWIIAWKNGDALTRQEWDDPNFTRPAGGGFNDWAMPGMSITLRLAIEKQDAAVEAQARDLLQANASGSYGWRVYSGANVP